ncbi:hypothetical protein QYE76_020276 [Lolium multiflorum]|uniref:F-box domain-containing protein n=1 Tax=Lolium multiflorum TaxID=4521 RepID=A0AAD8R828_LOLMU|nr:hypothetical protein QYE76_020276 [Lolium multiflorum]
MAATSLRRRSRDTATAAPLESLPPAMQDEILSRLPIRDAARTSVLSRAWRRRWETVPNRFHDWPLGTPADAIDHILAHCTQPVHEFRHPHVPVPDFSRSDHWLLRLAAVGVRSISVEFEWSNIIRIDEEAITNAPKLEVLEIELMVYVNTLVEVGIDFLYGQCADDLFSNLTNVRMKETVQDLLKTLMEELRWDSMEELLQELMSLSGIITSEEGPYYALVVSRCGNLTYAVPARARSPLPELDEQARSSPPRRRPVCDLRLCALIVRYGATGTVAMHADAIFRSRLPPPLLLF